MKCKVLLQYVYFNKTYFLFAILLLITEILIARYVHDGFVRPFGGDFVVVILLYCLVKTFVTLPALPAAVGVLLFAYCVEISQYFHLVKLLGLQNNKLAKILLGTTFSFMDLLAYTLGIGLVIIVENLRISLKKF